MNKFVAYIQIREALHTACDFQDLEEARYLIINFTHVYPDRVIIARLNMLYEIAIMKMCGTY